MRSEIWLFYCLLFFGKILASSSEKTELTAIASGKTETEFREEKHSLPRTFDERSININFQIGRAILAGACCIALLIQGCHPDEEGRKSAQDTFTFLALSAIIEEVLAIGRIMINRFSEDSKESCNILFPVAELLMASSKLVASANILSGEVSGCPIKETKMTLVWSIPSIIVLTVSIIQLISIATLFWRDRN